MVTTVSGYGRSGVADFVIQRATAIVLAAYTVFIIGYLVVTPDLTFEVWRGLFDRLWVRVFSLLALISIAVHAWIGLWAVLTDYITERMIGSSALALRMLVLAANAVVTVTYLFWGIELLWRL